MATYLKRTSKLFDLSLSRATADVHLRDLMCPVCRGILIEPVTLPCTHNLCLRCLKGTFEHNSLSCPLCRVRVGSWLRTATKSETLVNHGLWELIRTKFPKEVEDKHNGEERELCLDADFAANRILSEAGEIHREYEAQLQMAEEEMRRQRQAEQMASEALIQKIQAEEQQHLLAQLAQDQLLAKTLAKKQVLEKQKEATKCYNECLNTTVSDCVFDANKFSIKSVHINSVDTLQNKTVCLENRKMNLSDVKNGSELRRTNITLLSKIRAVRCSNVKTNASSMHKDSLVKYCCQKQTPVYNAVAKTSRHQTLSKFGQPCTSNYSTDPGCSTSKGYTTETKEELRIPGDVVNSKKKSLGIEVCMTLADDDERIGSAESSGSHDSINQEIHHFKPIKAMPRTPLKMSSDGKHLDPKLIRVVPILKRVSNVVPKAPSPTHIKCIIGCSWSAFRGKVKQGFKEKRFTHSLEDTCVPIDQKATSSLYHSHMIMNKLTKQVNDTIRRLDFIPESSFDSNKNYAKNANKLINGTKVNKKLSLDDESYARKTHKSWRTRVKNMVAKSKRQRNVWNSRKKTRVTLDMKNEDDDEMRGSSSSYEKTSPQNNERDGNNDVTVENIAERIKRRKVNAEKKVSKPEELSNISKRSTRKRVLPNRRDGSLVADQASVSPQEGMKLHGKTVTRAKRQRISRISQNSAKNLGRNELSTNMQSRIAVSSFKKLAPNSKGSSKTNELDFARNKFDSKCNYESPDSCDEREEYISENNNANNVSSYTRKHNFSDEDVIKEQQRIERLVLQEREDFELARRLQAKFDEMERISGRTRRSKKAIESANIKAGLCEIDAARTIKRSGAHTAKQPIMCQTVSTEAKKRGRPPKRVK